MRLSIIALILSIFTFSGLCFAEVITGKASWYSTEACRYNPDPKCPTASGDSLYTLIYELDLFAASWHYDFGTQVKVTNINNNRSVIVTIRDRGPAKRLKRQIDLGKYAFSKIASTKQGVIKVRIEKMPVLSQNP